MTQPRILFHVDDSLVARRLMAGEITKIDPSIQVKSFGSVADFIAHISTERKIPWAIFSDYNMPNQTGMDLLEWVKRQPDFHFIPVVMVTAEGEFADEAKKLGVFRYMNKPVEDQKLREVLDHLQDRAFDDSELPSLNQSFAEELSKIADELIEVSSAINEASLQIAYRLFHTAKGTAYSMQFPTIGTLVHDAESLLSAAQNSQAYGHPDVAQTIKEVTDYIQTQAQVVAKNQEISRPSESLVHRISGFVDGVKKGTIRGQGAATVPDANQGQGERSNERSSNVTRVKNEQIDELYGNFKNIVQIKNKVSRFSQQLKSEFNDESFPDELVLLVHDLNNKVMSIMDFFINLRLVTLDRLKRFSAVVLKEACEKAQKRAELDFNSEAYLEVDREVLESLEQNLLHIIRNSVDHGIEAPEVRKTKGKTEVGKLSLEVYRKNQDVLIVTLKDDGGGIDPNVLRKVMLKKGVISENDLNNLKDEQVYDLIFVDGVSTKESVTDLSGRGVGLSAVKENILKMGGKIRVDSSLNQGTTFTIELPRTFRL